MAVRCDASETGASVPPPRVSYETANGRVVDVKTPRDRCREFGISSDATIRKITEVAIASGAVAVWRPRKGPHLVGRPGTVFDAMQSGHPVKNGATKNGATLSNRAIPSESERRLSRS